MRLNENTKSEFENLERTLNSLEKPYISKEKVDLIKQRVLSKIDLPVADFVKLGSLVQIDSGLKARLKERIFALIEERAQKRFFWSELFLFKRKFVSAFLIFALFFGLFTFKGVDTGVVNAETFTVLESFSGEVSVERGGEKIEVYEKMKIFEQDRVTTGHEASATIRFFDDSVSRLSDDTEVVVEKMFRPDESPIKSYVELSVGKGIVWSRVVNLVEEESAFIVKAHDIATSTNKGAFNVDVDFESVQVGVFNNTVDINSLGKKDRLITGQKLVKESGNLGYIQPIEDLEKLTGWVKDNLDDDQQYLADFEKRLLVAKMESVGIENLDEISFDFSLTEKTLVFLTFDDVKKRKLELDLAEKNFVAAQVQLENLDLTSEEKAETFAIIAEFSKNVRDFYLLAEEVGSTDEEYSEELKSYAQGKVLSQKKNLSLALPDSALYEAKIVVDDLEVFGAGGNKEVAKVKRDQGLEKLSQAQDASLKGDKEVAENVLQKSKDDLEQAAEIIEQIEVSSEPAVREELEIRAEEDRSLVQTVDREVSPPPVEPVIAPEDPEVIEVPEEKVLPPQLSF